MGSHATVFQTKLVTTPTFAQAMVQKKCQQKGIYIVTDRQAVRNVGLPEYRNAVYSAMSTAGRENLRK